MRGKVYDPTVLKDKLKAGREYRGMKQEWLGQQIGKTVTGYGKYETGPNMPPAETLAQIANIERLDLAFYFTPEMTPQEADLDLKRYVAPLAQMEQYVSAMERRVASAEETDPVLKRLREKIHLYEIVDLIDEEDTFTLARIKDGIVGMLALLKAPAHPFEGKERQIGRAHV